MRVYSEKIDVVHEAGNILSFRWRDEEFQVETILAQHQDWRFPAGAPKKRTWRLRRHRNYYTVRTTNGRVFEIYFDRGAATPQWILYRELPSA